jgi:hypothetical protein
MSKTTEKPQFVLPMPKPSLKAAHHLVVEKGVIK